VKKTRPFLSSLQGAAPGLAGRFVVTGAVACLHSLGVESRLQIGTVLFLPFLIVDMVVASITTSVGMLQLPPVVISTPLKLLLFLWWTAGIY